VFERDGHVVYLLDEAEAVAMVPPDVSRHGARIMPNTAAPSLVSRATGDVARLLADSTRGLPPPGPQGESTPYGRKLTLDVLSQPTAYAGVNSFGPFVGGSVAALFSDMLGDRILAADIAVNSEVRDIGAGLTYINRRQRWNWAGTLRIDPYRSGYLQFKDRRRRDDHRDGSHRPANLSGRIVRHGVSIQPGDPVRTDGQRECRLVQPGRPRARVRQPVPGGTQPP
jgi:hypothetical protein